MPFTVSHVAAVLPLHRWLSRLGLFTAAVIGSMTPDFGIILFHDFTRTRTHSLGGLWRFCLPIGLAVFVITRYLIKPAFVEVVSDGPYARVEAASAANRPLRLLDWCTVALVIVLGAVTHLIWDGFTHEGAPGVRMFPVLDEVGTDIDGHALRFWRLLQYGSSMAGLVAVMIAIGLWLRHAAKAPRAGPLRRRLSPAERLFWSALYLAIPFCYLTVSALRHGFGDLWPPLGARLGTLLYGLMRGSVVSLIGVSSLIRLRLFLLERLNVGH
jgi:hypothetical protein